MELRTRDQRFAAAAYERVAAVGKNFVKGSKERQYYGSMAHKLPVLIRTAGLAQALAFVHSKATGGDEGTRRTAYQRLLADLAGTVNRGMSDKDLVERSREADFLEYLHLTQQVLAALLWYKRYAESVLGVVAGDEEVDS